MNTSLFIMAGFLAFGFYAGFACSVFLASLAKAEVDEDSEAYWNAYAAGYDSGFAHGESHALAPDEPIGSLSAAVRKVARV